MQRKRELLALYVFPLFLLFVFSSGLNRENNVYLSKEKVKSMGNDSLIVATTLSQISSHDLLCNKALL